MTAKTKAQIKSFFETNDKPTQAQFIDFIDSYVDMAGPMGTLQTEVSAGANGVMVGAGGTAFVDSYSNVRTSMNVTVYTTALAQSALVGLFATTADVSGISQGLITSLYATTAQANAGTDGATLMNPVLVKNAISSQVSSSSQVVLLSTQTASSSATLDFTSAITSSYSQYLFVFEALLPSTSAALKMYISSNNGSTWTGNVITQRTTISLGGTTPPSYTGENTSPVSLTGSESTQFHGTMSLSDPLSATNPAALFFGQFGITSADFSEFRGLSINQAVNAVRFQMASGTFTSGKIYLYGIKNT